MSLVDSGTLINVFKPIDPDTIKFISQFDKSNLGSDE
jgi:hypothetical protein